MKNYSFSKEDLAYLVPVEANKQALDVAIRVYIVNVVLPRLGIKPTQEVKYDIGEGTLDVKEEPIAEKTS